ncbi:MAG: hypothetical protein U9O95_08150 [Candidatus Marinimicrobia bacterium]|nr:hypothetical protein [Candidatus Neomarinimicrobiota bacterium]
MRAINKNAKKVMDALTAKCEHLGDHDKFHTEGPFMDVVVECIDGCDFGPMFSVAHYYEQNGDLMRDPEMCFVKGGDGEYYPYYYRLDGLGIERFALTFDYEGNIEGIRKSEQGEQAVFAGKWMMSIKRQQGLVM